MRLARNFRLSLRALAVHRLRASLAVAGAGLGVAGVLVVSALSTGARAATSRELDQLGRDLLIVMPADPNVTRSRSRGRMPVRTLTPEDAEALVDAGRDLLRAAPAQDADLRARVGRVSARVTVLGTTAQWPSVRDFDLTEGTFFSDADNLLRRRVAVLGADARAALFPDSAPAVGATVRVRDLSFVVVGVLERKGVSVTGASTEDNRIIVPLETMRKRVTGREYLDMIYIQAADPERLPEAEDEAAAILRSRHVGRGTRDDFTVQNQRKLIEAELEARASMQRLTLSLGALALIVGAAGILAVQLIAVAERRSEIGLRVATGARRRDIVTQFLAEALMLALGGGVVGIVLGGISTAALATATGWEVQITAAVLGVAAGGSIGIGVLAGTLPAWRASALDPSDALRG